MKKASLSNRGFMRIVLLVIVVITAFAYFNVDLRGILDNPIIQKIWVIIKGAWYSYLVPLWGYLVTSVTAIFN